MLSEMRAATQFTRTTQRNQNNLLWPQRPKQNIMRQKEPGSGGAVTGILYAVVEMFQYSAFRKLNRRILPRLHVGGFLAARTDRRREIILQLAQSQWHMRLQRLDKRVN
jgi:hypothetical protein